MEWERALANCRHMTDGAPLDAFTLVNVTTEAELLRQIADHLTQGHGFAVATLNLDHIVKLRLQPDFLDAYLAHTHVVADGNPVVWLARLAGRRHVRLVPGSELIAPLTSLAADRRVPVAFFGSTDAVLRAAAKRLTAADRNLTVAACLSPAFGFDPRSAQADALLDEVAASGARICFLALGAPKQEIFAARGLARHPHLGFVSIGAGLDFIAGHQSRAPLWVRKIAMEWLWRTLTNPRRLVRRYLDCILILPSLTFSALAERSRRRRGKP